MLTRFDELIKRFIKEEFHDVLEAERVKLNAEIEAYNAEKEKLIAVIVKGTVFFDYNPAYFGFILDYLRAKKMATPENPAPLPDVADNQVKNFQNLVGYLGLSEEIAPTKTVQTDKFSLRSPEITLQEDGKVAVHDSNKGHKYVLGENTYQQGVVRFKLKVESF